MPITIGVVTLEMRCASFIQRARPDRGAWESQRRPAPAWRRPCRGRRRRWVPPPDAIAPKTRKAAPTVSPNRRPWAAVNRAGIPVAIRWSPSTRLRRFLEHERAEHQHVHVGAHEAAVGVLRRADDRLAADVERRVHQHRTAGLRSNAVDQMRGSAGSSPRVTVWTRAE